MKQETKPIVNIKPVKNQENKNQNKFFLVMSFIFLGALLVSFVTPVYYVPLFSNISLKYGLSGDIARKLTLLDLALSSLGIETPNMAIAFKKQSVDYQPDVFYTSRFNTDNSNRLINAKKTYYYEYERTRKRPDEIAGIYQDGKAVNTPEIDGELKGVRALPKDDYFDDFSKDDGFTDFTYKKATATTASQDEVMGSKRRQVRGSFDRDNQGQAGQSQTSSKPEPLPDFAYSVYSSGDEVETQILENSRMIKPIIAGELFSVVKSDGVTDKIIRNRSFTESFASLNYFGGYDGNMGFYVKDNMPIARLIDFFGSSGQDVFSSYFYSNAAVGKKYLESSKHLSEIAFNGDEPQEEILVARGQTQDKVPTIDPSEMSPLSFVLTVKENLKECEEGRKRYEEVMKQVKPLYENAKAGIIGISQDSNNVAWRGAPGSCNSFVVPTYGDLSAPAINLRRDWNLYMIVARQTCIAIRQAGEAYASSCKMEYKLKDNTKDSCEAIDALEVTGGTDWPDVFGGGICRNVVKWARSSNSFSGCGGNENFNNQNEARQDCITKVNGLFKEIDENFQLEPVSGFMFN